MKRYLLLIIVVIGYTFKSAVSKCVQGQNCKLPSCFCGTYEHPLGRRDVPQIVYFAIDDGVNSEVAEYYNRLFHPSRKNPNGCPITATLMATIKGTDFNLLQDFYNRGFEIATHADTSSAITNSTILELEIKTERQTVLDNVVMSANDIQGWRSPYLKTIGDEQIRILKKLGYRYDTSKTFVRKNATDGNNVFPLTADFPWPYACNIPPCWSESHSKFWEVPINSLWDYKKAYPCPTADGCHNRPDTEEDARKFIMMNFKNSYRGNRAPLGFHLIGKFFRHVPFYRAMDRFIQEILVQPDVYIIPISKMLDWMEQPVPLSQVIRYAPWKCASLISPTPAMPALPTITPPLNAERCVQGQSCKLPSCFCQSFDHFMNKTTIPQIVYIAIDDALDSSVSGYFERLLFNRTNPNRCPISATFFVTTTGTNYSIVRDFYSKGMEIGSHSVSRDRATTREALFRGARLSKENLATYADIPLSDIKGFRSPDLATAGDDQAEILRRLGYTYDISYTFTRPKSYAKNVWPLTADYGWPLKCNIPPCLQRPHRGFWEVPVNSMWDYTNTDYCTFADECRRPPPTQDHVRRYLTNNFKNSYEGNRAPFGIHLHGRWFQESRNLMGFERFLNYLQALPDVYIVSVKKMLDWMKYPTALNQVQTFGPWKCKVMKPLSQQLA
ncbi:uncharacterized protein LOC125651501 [Ostrea edulis]|uniref:uncharacterized protein LOC125651501 n=1 Tax=Ostrea edulis TaxID=37623 RepID=UPI0024AEECCE|nr:uncharacterized protein LOC125651501 [Ostrea edulis]